MDTIYATLGARLRAERERLGWTQQQFAELCGVHRRTQGNYERDIRVPDAGYWSVAGGLGVDIEYVHSGILIAIEKLPSGTLEKLLLKRVLSALGYSDGAIDDYVRRAYELEQELAAADTHAAKAASLRAAESSAKGLIMESPLFVGDRLDGAMLGRSIAAVEQEMARACATPSVERRGQLVVAVYRGAVALGRIDEQMVKDAVALTI